MSTSIMKTNKLSYDSRKKQITQKKIDAKNKKHKYEIWITYDSNKEAIQIPVMPEKVTISYPENNGKEEVCGIGDITIKEKRGRFQLKFSSSFPDTQYQGSIKNPLKPKKYVDFLKKCMKLDGPCRMILTGSPLRMNSLVTISFEVEEQGGDVGTVYYSLTATEWRETNIRKLDIRKKKNGKKTVKKKSGTNRANTKEKKTTYTVKSGDYLMKIAKETLGDSSRWREIYEKNKGVIGQNPNMIQAGMVLAIP